MVLTKFCKSYLDSLWKYAFPNMHLMWHERIYAMILKLLWLSKAKSTKAELDRRGKIRKHFNQWWGCQRWNLSEVYQKNCEIDKRVCVCVCVRERERERERKMPTYSTHPILLIWLVSYTWGIRKYRGMKAHPQVRKEYEHNDFNVGSSNH